jgi:hypothetical protein
VKSTKRDRKGEQMEKVQFDYANQAWVVDGVYVACGHAKPCNYCYGTKHEGEQPAPDAELE